MNFVEFLAALLLSGAKNLPSAEFHGFPSTIDRARTFVSVSIDGYLQQQDTNDFSMSDDDFNSDASSEDNPDYDFYDILQGFQPTEFKYVPPILALMEEDPKILTWDKHTGEIIFQNKPVKDSNVIELLKDSLTDNMHPVGKMEFY